ncbi:MAG: hypothetical protein IIA87_02975 [Nanoarchaeota archaeon]|nr:hypothetical protein [Nanoarchaeota archaeon]
MKKERFGLEDFVNDFGYFHTKMDKLFLKELLVKAAKDDKPHYNKKLIIQLGMKFTKNRDHCKTIYGWTTYEKTIPLNKLAKIIKLSRVSWKEVESNIFSIKAGQKKGEIKPNFPIKINKNLGTIVGHILGDGAIDKKYQQISFSNSDKFLLHEFKDHMREIFSIKPRIWMQKSPDFGNTKWDKRLNNIDELEYGRNCGLFYPSICGLLLNSIFDNFAVGKNKRITKKILAANSEFKKGLIRAFFDDEATVDIKSRYIRIFQDRVDILEDFRTLLKEFNIIPREIKCYIKGDKKRYYFNISKEENLKLFRKKIGFTSPKKESKLDLIITHQA